MEIRGLKTKDFFKVSTIIGKMSGDALKEIAGMDQAQAGAAFISKAFKYAETDVKEWLADIAQTTAEAFDDMPFDAPLHIIEKLAEKENIKAFLQRVMALKDKFSK